MILTNRRAMFACTAAIFAMVFTFFIEPIYSNYLISIGFSENYIGYAFASCCFFYTIMAPIVGKLCKIVPKILLTQFAFIAAFISLIVIGPSQFLGFKESATLSVIGYSMLGFSVSFIFIPLLSEINEAVKVKEGITEESE